MSSRPAYDELPGGRATGLYGPDDQLGCLNLLTPDRTRAAAALVRTGVTHSLNAPVGYPRPYPAASQSARKAPTHVVIRTTYGRDEYLDGLYPQAGSQWDHFLHVFDPDNGDCFYNGSHDESIGMSAWGQRGIVGRGVLLDVARWREAQGRAIDWRVRDEVSVSDLERCAADQGVEISEGTILVLRFGWESGWSAASFAERMSISETPPFQSPGLEASVAMVRRLWDWGVAAVGSDVFALEAFPLKDGYFMHIDLLARIGLPIGELWHVDELARACAQEGRHEFLFTSAPLNLPGGIGSTANALAVM